MFHSVGTSKNHETLVSELLEANRNRRWTFGKILRWFCGLEDMRDKPQTSEEDMLSKRRISSLVQTTLQRNCLFIALVALLAMNLFLYIFFSAGSKF